MKEPVFIFTSGELKRESDTLMFISKEGKKYIPISAVNEIFIFGELTINKRLLEFLTQKKIILHFFNYYGYYTGSYYPREHYNSGYMILRQAEAYMNENRRLFLAKCFVKGATENSLKILNYYNRRGKKLSDIIEQIRELLSNIEIQEDISNLMSLEAIIKKEYYKSFAQIITNIDFEFIHRSKQPPKDYINTLISFSNVMIYSFVLSDIYKTHLDPRIGYLHSTNNRRYTLNLDVAEIFKPVIGDRTIFSAVNKGIITKKDFVNELNGILFTESGRKKFLSLLEERLKQTIKHHKLKRKVSYRRLIRMELYKIEKYLIEDDKYQPFIMDW